MGALWMALLEGAMEGPIVEGPYGGPYWEALLEGPMEGPIGEQY